MLVLGDADDARGFALVGAKTRRCATREDVVRALRAMDPDTSIVVFSRKAAALAPAEVDALVAAARGPIAIVLPEPGGVP